MKTRDGWALWIVMTGSCLAWADVQPATDILVTVQGKNPEQIWLRSIQMDHCEIPAERLVSGSSTGTATAVAAPYDNITNADNLDLNLFAGRNGEDPPEWRITHLGGKSLYRDNNGEQPDFFVFETNGNDAIVIQAILPDGSLGRGVDIPTSTWGDTGLRVTASVHGNQKIMGLCWSLTDLLDGQGRPLTIAQAISGILITSPDLDPACFCAVMGPPANQPPHVDVGEDIYLLVPATLAPLSGTVTDDGQGDPNGYLSYRWAWLEGPGPVLFEPNAFVLSPVVSLQGGPGEYVLELSATDGILESTGQVTVYLQAAEGMGQVVRASVEISGHKHRIERASSST